MKKLAAILIALTALFALSVCAYAAPDSATEVERLVAGENAPESTAEKEVQGPAPLKKAETEPTEATEATEAPTEPATLVAQPGTQPVTESRSNTSQIAAGAVENGSRTAIIIAAIAGSVLLIVLIIVAAVVLRRKKPSGVRGLTVRVEVLSGLCYNTEFIFPLRRELTIGVDRKCDLVFEDPGMLPVHAVITRSAGTITLSECGDTGNTYIGGMKIFAPNRLRSGDIITIADTSFCVYID